MKKCNYSTTLSTACTMHNGSKYNGFKYSQSEIGSPNSSQSANSEQRQPISEQRQPIKQRQPISDEPSQPISTMFYAIPGSRAVLSAVLRAPKYRNWITNLN